MQPSLFEPVESHEGERPKVQRPRKPQPPGESEPLEQTLFGPIETKGQARKRAQRIVQLHGAIREAPEARECCLSDIQTLDYFIQRSQKIALDPNDLDGLQRLVGDTEDLLSQNERRQMRENQTIWRRFPAGWIGARPGAMYPAALHPKELLYLRQRQEERRQEMDAIAEGVEDCRAELGRLLAIGPLPDAIAQKYALTPNGEPLNPSAARTD